MRRMILRLVVLALVALPVLAVWAAIEPAPLVVRPNQATPESARATRDFVHRVRAVTNDGADPDQVPEVVLSLEEINGAIAFFSRLIPGLRGEAASESGGLRLRASVPVPGIARLGWINLDVLVPPFEQGPRLASVRVGGLDLPPGTSLALAEGLANIALGGGTGTRIMASVPRISITADSVTAELRMDGAERGSLTRRVARVLRGDEMPRAEEIQSYYLALRAALEAGTLPDSGSFLPYLRHTGAMVLERAEPGREGHELTAALFALTKLCGAWNFRLVVGRLVEGVVPQDEPPSARTCDEITFAGRIDSRRHFITAAAIKAASTRKVSFTIGEYKELVDTLTGAGGFDFTDIVANASGIRFAETLMAAPRADWPRLLGLLTDEAAVIASFDGIPGLMPGEDFASRFGDTQSPAYAAMVAQIEARIDALPLHRATAAP